MGIQRLDFGTAGNNDGEYLRTAFQKLDANDDDLDGRVTTLETEGVPGLAEHIADAAGAHDASAISFTRNAVGAVLRDLRSKVSENPVSVLDFLGVDPTGVLDSTAGIAAAVTAAGVGGSVYYPKGVYTFSDHDTDGYGLTQLSGQRWYGDGRAATILRLSASTTNISILIRAADFATDYSIENMQIDGNRANITPAVDLYNNFNMIIGPRGGKRGLYRNLLLANNWGRSLQTSNESVSEYAEDILVDGVWVKNGGTKAISATQSRRVTIANCFAEVNAYTSSDHPGGVGDGNAGSGSCFEFNDAQEATLCNSHGIQIGATVIGPGIRCPRGYNIKIHGNTIRGASYLGFIQNSDDVHFFDNTGINNTGNAILVGNDDDVSSSDTSTSRIHIYNNTIIDPAGAYVIVSASRTGASTTEVYIYDNDFVQISGSPTHGIYNFGVVSPATSGSCVVYEWNNKFVGTIPNHFAGPAAAADIRPKPPVSRDALVTKTANFTLAASENNIINNKSGSACVATLPAASGWVGREVTLKTVQPFPITSNSSDVVPVEGGSAGTAIVPGIPGAWARIRSDGTNWVVIERPVYGWQIVGQSSAASATHTGTLSETTIATITVPAGRMGANGRLRITCHWSNNNSGNNKTMRIRFGGSQSFAAANTTNLQTRFQIEIGNRNSESVQICGLPGNSTGFGPSSSAVLTHAINTASSANITLTAQLADVGDSLVLQSYVVELLYAP